MELGLTGKRAVVAAASSGLGFAVAQALAAEGAKVAICGRDPHKLAQAANSLGSAAVPLQADVSTPEGAAGFVAAANARLGGIDILIVNVGGPPAGTFASTPLDSYAQATQTHVLSVVAMCSTAVPEMRTSGWGRVLAISSITVLQPVATMILSTTARAGAAGFLKTLAREIACEGVTVNMLLPAYHDTDRLRSLHSPHALEQLGRELPAGRIGDPLEFGALAAFLCSQQAGFITGTAIAVDGGYHAGLL